MAKANKIKKQNQLNQAKIMFIAFSYFSIVLEENKKSEVNLHIKLKNMFHPLARISFMYQHLLEETVNDVSEAVKEWNKDSSVDYLLLSVSIIVDYYEVLKGKKRYFSPMKCEDILDLQEECMGQIEKERKDNMINNTFDFSEFLVNKILNEDKL
jgi:hypothetical protein